jgi:hypothetical protein
VQKVSLHAAQRLSPILFSGVNVALPNAMGVRPGCTFCTTYCTSVPSAVVAQPPEIICLHSYTSNIAKAAIIPRALSKYTEMKTVYFLYRITRDGYTSRGITKQ